MNNGWTAGARWRRWLVIGVVQFVIVLLLAEFAVRLVGPRHRGLRMLLNSTTDTTDFSDADTLPELMNRTMLGFNPGSVEYGFVLNSRSFRTREYALGPAGDRFRVVALGDSFTFASGALPHEDHWTTVTEEELGRRVNRPVEVLRLGVPDTGPVFQLRLWQIEASKLEPDVVVLAFFVGNDFIDHQGDCGVFGGGDRGLSGRLASVSALYRVARILRRVWRDAAEPPGAVRSNESPVPGGAVPEYGETFDPSRPTFTRERFIGIEAERMALCLRSEDAAFRRLADRTSGVVTQLADEVRETGARFVVMMIPDQYQVDPTVVEEVLSATATRLEDYDLERPQRVLGQVLEPAGVEVLDLLPIFRRAAPGEELYRLRDTHWNRRGNEVAAMALADVLTPIDGLRGSALFSDGLESGRWEAWSVVESR